MTRVVVLAALLGTAAWLAHDTGWLTRAAGAIVPLEPHDAYRALLRRTGLDRTASGRAWIDDSVRVLETPSPVTLPYNGRFDIASGESGAHAFALALKRGQRLDVIADLGATGRGRVFVDVFEPRGSGGAHRAGALGAAQAEASADRELIVRVQPELSGAGRLRVALRAGPALRYPVAGATRRDLHSAFGDPRDGGRRQHEGVDIFAPRGTRVLSAAGGLVSRVAETGRGGRVVWVWNPVRGLSFYYAHLDEQLVSVGERVEPGDPIGTVGNSGNARTTPPHLHFGIYERGAGAIDPYWFIVPAAP